MACTQFSEQPVMKDVFHWPGVASGKSLFCQIVQKEALCMKRNMLVCMAGNRFRNSFSKCSVCNKLGKCQADLEAVRCFQVYYKVTEPGLISPIAGSRNFKMFIAIVSGPQAAAQVP